MNYRIAIIAPQKQGDTLADTIFNGLIELQKINPELQFYLSTDYIWSDLKKFTISEASFIEFAKDADLIFLIWGKKYTNFALAQKLNQWQKTVYIDGSEVGNNNRYDFNIQYGLLNGEYSGYGEINQDMLVKCPLYFRREKPYTNGIIPLPFGIESSYIHYSGQKKDIDFNCIFGQDEYPLMRRYAKEILIKFCLKNSFTFSTEKTSSPIEFYKLLARSKVGISVGGGGYDTLRFWEILGNNCLLFTESIDIFQPNDKIQQYSSIWQFNNLYDFEYYLDKLGEYLKNQYNQEKMEEEYRRILNEHSTKARVETIITEAKKKKIIN